MKFIEELKFDSNGLIPAVVQDWQDGTILMVAYMNKESVKRTWETKIATFWSRSRQKFWIKGEQSGNIQEVKDLFYDCDADCLLIKVNQVGKAACHTGYRSCFYRRPVDGDKVEIVSEKIFDPDEVYKK